MEWLESEEFYTLMQAYRHASVLDQAYVVEAFEEVKNEIRKNIAQWQPIETAPKDFVTNFDGWNGKRVADVSWARPEGSPENHYAWCISEYDPNYGYVNVQITGLTHWMPLPPPPKD